MEHPVPVPEKTVSLAVADGRSSVIENEDDLLT